MAIGDRGEAVRQLRGAYQTGSVRDWTDGQLLERFAGGPAEVRDLAFSALIERHGPMVLGVCRGILGGRHDAEDAFQATFLVLVRQARGLWVRDSIGPWLHRVAHRTAVAARVAASRQARIERLALPAEDAQSPGDDLARVVHEEVARLAERDRAVVVLCDLEGLTHEQAARSLGWPVGSVKSRLFRARDRLRLRLARRGLAPEGAASSAPTLLSGPLPALAPDLVSHTAAVAIGFASGGPGFVPTAATTLALGVLKTMTLSRLIHSASATALTALALAAGSSWLMAGAAPQDPAAPAKEAAKPDRPEIPTVVARLFVKSEFIAEEGRIIPPKGIEVANPFQAETEIEKPIPITWSIPLGSRVKKEDLLYRFDTSPLRERLSQYESRKAAAQDAVAEGQKELETARAALKEYKEKVEARRREATEAEVGAAREAVRRAEARVKRYREANETAARVAIDMSDPTSLARTLARLDLADRLDGVEAELDRERTRLIRVEAEASKVELTEDPAITQLEKQVASARQSFSDRSKKLNLEALGEKAIRDKIAIDEIRSPADGIVAQASIINPNGAFGQVKGLCRIITAPEPFQLIRVSLPGESRIGHLKPGQSVLVRFYPRDPAKKIDRTSIPATFLEPWTTNTVDLTGGEPRRLTARMAVLRLESPLDQASHESIRLEYSALVPTGGVEIPARAVEDGRVAVRGEDGTFRWRALEFNGVAGDRVIVSKMLGDGEVIALDPRAAMGLPPREKEVETPAEPAPKGQ